jgi:hypothetical protein
MLVVRRKPDKVSEPDVPRNAVLLRCNMQVLSQRLAQSRKRNPDFP